MSIIKSASLILINRIQKSIHYNDFKLLLLKRIATSQSFANKMVFPGGVLDKCDYADEWSKILNKEFSSSHLKTLICEKEMSIYKNSKVLSDINPEIFYRICAIRETFEETGILIAIDKFHKPLLHNDDILKDIKKSNWQKKVLKDGNLFIELFKSYNLIPDLFSLYEWAEWLTPSIVKRRFHTAFFILISNSPLTTNINEEESNSLIWQSPKEAIDECASNKELAPPQFSELFEMSLLSWDDLQIEALRRQRSGGMRNISLMINLSNGTLMVLHGDSRYLEHSDVDSIDLSHFSMEDLDGDTCLRRCFSRNGYLYYQHNLNSRSFIM